MNKTDMTRSKEVMISLRLSHEEHEFLKQLAQESHLTISNYIRYRVFEEVKLNDKEFTIQEGANSKGKFACDHDREVMRYVIRTFLYTRYMADKVLDAAKVEECNQMARKQLRAWRYDE